MKLDRTTTTLMKGYGILFIALHNFLHWHTGFVKENENTFDVQRTFDFFGVLRTFEWSDFGQFFFLGWIGVPVFLFISGYGLVKKYENNKNAFKKGQYVFHSWRKLFLLLLPAAIYAVILSLVIGDWKTVIPMKVLQLTMLHNLLVRVPINFTPGVYWYFSLTFELYLMYLLVRQWHVKQLLALLGGVIIIQVVTAILSGTDSGIWFWVRHNFTGWGQIFLTGMIVAKINIEEYLPQKVIIQLLVAVLCLVFLPILLLNKWAWLLLVPFVALLFFVFLAGAVSKSKVLKSVGVWLGTYSSFIFVVHPIARELIILLENCMGLSVGLVTFAYVSLFIIGAIIYKPIYNWLMNLKVSSSFKLK